MTTQNDNLDGLTDITDIIRTVVAQLVDACVPRGFCCSPTPINPMHPSRWPMFLSVFIKQEDLT